MLKSCYSNFYFFEIIIFCKSKQAECLPFPLQMKIKISSFVISNKKMKEILYGKSMEILSELYIVGIVFQTIPITCVLSFLIEDKQN
jgi:hypothetical protein